MNTTLKSYTIGLLTSIILTLIAYFLVAEHVIAGWGLTLTLIALAIAQALVQLVLFLHLGDESHPRWKLLVFSFMVLVLSILVFGSLWIMYNLDSRMM